MSQVQPGDILAGRYVLSHRRRTDLRGVSSWDARDDILDRPVQAMIVTVDHAPAVLDSARLASIVSHPGLQKIHDIDSADNIHFIISEATPETSLTELMSHRQVTDQQARAIVGEVARSLAAAHSRGRYHTAIRPESITVTESRILLHGLGIDSALAKITPPDADTARQCDIHQLTAILYYLVTARWPGPPLGAPWLDPQAVQPLAAARHAGRILSLGETAPHLPEELIAWCDSIMGEYLDDGGTWGTVPTTKANPIEDLISMVEPWTWPIPDAQAHPATHPNEPDLTPLPLRVQRQSIRSAFGASTVPPGTPPPAPPLRRVPTPLHPAALTAPAMTPASPAPPVPSATALFDDPAQQPLAITVLAEQMSSQEAVPDQLLGGQRRNFNPTMWALLAAIVSVVAGLGWALSNAFGVFASSEPPTSPTPRPSDTSTTTSPPPQKPLIVSAVPLDPEGYRNGDSEGEHPEASWLAFDRDPATFWSSRTYKTAEFGNLKSGIGYAFTLQQEAEISSIVLYTGNIGGHVELRATSPDTPLEGEPLGSSALSSLTTITWERPVNTDSLVLWFSELPTTSDGHFRVELNEIEVS